MDRWFGLDIVKRLIAENELFGNKFWVKHETRVRTLLIEITINENYIIGKLLSKNELVKHDIRFEEIHNDNSIEV